MSKSRRNFLAKMTMALTAFFTFNKNSSANYKNNETMQIENKNPILNIKPLGFQWETSDPFLFCVHHDDKFPQGNDQMEPQASLEGRHIGQDFILKDGWRMYHGTKVPGFPGHPHRGFETITVVREGTVDHADSMGGAGRYGDGDVQWMTAGKGLQHSEMFPLIHKDKQNPMELFQIWLNLPKKSKMVKPHFKMLWAESIPVFKSDNQDVEIEVIAGKLEGLSAAAPPPDSWAADGDNEVAVWNIMMKANSEWILPQASAGLNRTLYFYEGDELSMENKAIKPYHAVVLLSDQKVTIKNGNTASKLLLLQGKPIDEPVVQHGPFVMNSRQEIHEAFEDYQKDQFGGWPWSRIDPVHDRSKGRFALHADGRVEKG